MTVSMQQSMEKFAFSHHQQKMQEFLVDKYDETNQAGELLQDVLIF